MFVKSIDNFKSWRYNKSEHFFSDKNKGEKKNDNNITHKEYRNYRRYNNRF